MKLGKKILLMITAIFVTIIVTLGAYITTAYNFLANELSRTFKNYKTSDSSSNAIEQTEPIPILLMGVDTGDLEYTSAWEGNSNSMILAIVNPETKRTTMTSLECDVLVTLTGSEDNDMNGAEAKLNAAHASGGVQMATMTVRSLLDITIDYYVQTNMQGLVDLVNAVGGITVTNSFNFVISIAKNEPEYTATVEPGTHKINGEQALVYARMRYDDPEGDYGHQKRQREVIQKVLKKILALDSVSLYKKILSAVSSNTQTNIEIPSSMIPSLLGYTDALSDIETYQLQGEDMTINGTSYQIVTSDHLLEIQDDVKKRLGLDESITLQTTAVLHENLYGSGTSDSYDSGYSDYSSSSGYDSGYSGYNSDGYSDYSIDTYSDYSARSY